MRHMRTSAPALAPIFRSALQAHLLLHVLTTDEPVTAAELARILREPEPTVSREVRRLLDSGLLSGSRVGRATVVGPAFDNPATAPLRQLLVVTYGPASLVERALRSETRRARRRGGPSRVRPSGAQSGPVSIGPVSGHQPWVSGNSVSSFA